MHIALIASNMKKEIMLQFCTAYCGILARNTICATYGTGKIISDSTGLPVNCYLPGDQGGVQQIVSRVMFNEIDLVVMFADHGRDSPEKKLSLDMLIEACNLHDIPLATNIATAELLIRAAGSGELDWRNYVNPISDYNTRHKSKFVKVEEIK